MSDRFYLIPAGLAAVLVVFGGALIGFGMHLSRQASQSGPGVVMYEAEGPSNAAPTVYVGDVSPLFWVGGGVMLLGTPFGYAAYRFARARK